MALNELSYIEMLRQGGDPTRVEIVRTNGLAAAEPELTPQGVSLAAALRSEPTEPEALARRKRKSRSDVSSAALREYVARHAPEEVTEAMNRVCYELAGRTDAFVAAASRRVLARIEWQSPAGRSGWPTFRLLPVPARASGGPWSWFRAMP